MRILIIFESVPLPDGGGADHRLMQIVGLLCAQGHAVTFLAPRHIAAETREAELKQLGVELRLEDADLLAREGVDREAGWTLEQVLSEGQFELAILSLWFWMGVTLPEHYLDQIRRFSPETRIAILTDDAHGLREQGAAEISGLWTERERAVDFAEREMEIYRRADLVMAISEADREAIGRGAGGNVPVEILPVMMEPGPDGPGFDEREGIVYFGHYKNPPSLDGLEWYLDKVAPLVRRELPEVKLYLLGAGLPETWPGPDPQLIRIGFRIDLAPEFAKRRLLVSPVRFGTGLKTKNLHATAHGLPVVTNTKGSDGAHFANGETALIADDPGEFAAHVVKLYRDPVLWMKLSENSRAHAAKYFSSEAMDGALDQILSLGRRLEPKPFDPSHVWSMRLIENLYPEVASHRPSSERRSVRIAAYSRAADQLIARGDQKEGRRQLRHVFSYLAQARSRRLFYSRFRSVAESIERSYRALGDLAAAEALGAEAARFCGSVFERSDEAARPLRSGDL